MRPCRKRCCYPASVERATLDSIRHFRQGEAVRARNKGREWSISTVKSMLKRTSLFPLRKSWISGLSTRGQLAVFLGCVLPLLWILVAFGLQRLRDQTLADGQRDAGNLTHVFAEKTRSTVHVLDLTLIDLRDGWLGDRQNFGAKVRARQVLRQNEAMFRVNVVDAHGKSVFSSGDAEEPPIEPRDHEYFDSLGGAAGDALLIRKAVAGPASQRGEILFIRPLPDPQGGFAGVIMLSVAPEYFIRFSQAVNLGPGTSITVRHSNGELLMRWPFSTHSLSEMQSEMSPLAAPTSTTGTFRGVSRIDGIERQYTWRALPEYGLVVTIGRAMNEVLSPYLRQKQIYLLVGVGISLLLALLGTILLAGLKLRSRALAALEQGDSGLKSALESAGEGVWEWNNETGEGLYYSRWAELLGYADHELGNRIQNWRHLVDPDDSAALWAATEDYISGRTPVYAHEFRVRCKDGSWKWISSQGIAISRNAQGLALRMIGIHVDITERKQAEESMRLASLMYENSNEGMLVTDAENTIITINQAFTALTGYSAEEVVGKQPNMLSSGRHDREFYGSMWQSMRTTGRWQGEIWNRRRNGDVYAEWLSINTLFKETGEVYRRVALFSDLARKKEYENLIWQQANGDPLTGLLNRRMFGERLEQAVQRAHSLHAPMAMLFLDLDLFKEINDTLGHSSGDLLLCGVAQRLRAQVAESNCVGRLGGDEFAVIVENFQDHEAIKNLADEILRELGQPFQLGSEKVFISASIGMTLYPGDARTSEGLLKSAEQAMYAAKNQGRDRASFFTASMQETAQTRMRLTTDLRGALAANQFRVVYQPIVELATAAVYKAEALIRWHHPVRGLVSPVDFIPIAEQTGLIRDIGDWVFLQSAREVKRLRAAHDTRFQISVNASPVQLRDKNDAHETWAAYLHELDLPGRSMTIEITEGLLLDAGAVVSGKLASIRATGIQIALDDFGTGYSSLSYLKKFDIDYLKIDQSFVRNLKSPSDDLVLCNAIIVMAHALGLKVIAEGIETSEQRKLLTAAGCDYGQGYLFSRPVPAVEFEAWLERWQVESTQINQTLITSSTP